MTLLDLTLPAVKTTSVKDLQKMISETPDFEEVTGSKDIPLITDEDVRTAARKYIRIKLDLGEETADEAKQENPDHVPLEPGYNHVNVQEALHPEQALLKAGFQTKEEGLRLLEAIRRDAEMIKVKQAELNAREAEVKKGEAELEGRKASLNKKASEVAQQYAQYQDLFSRVEAARKAGTQI